MKRKDIDDANETMDRKELGIDKDDGSETILQKFKERLEGKDVPKEAKEAERCLTFGRCYMFHHVSTCFYS